MTDLQQASLLQWDLTSQSTQLSDFHSSRPHKQLSTCLTTFWIHAQSMHPLSSLKTAAQWCMYQSSRRVQIARSIWLQPIRLWFRQLNISKPTFHALMWFLTGILQTATCLLELSLGRVSQLCKPLLQYPQRLERTDLWVKPMDYYCAPGIGPDKNEWLPLTVIPCTVMVIMRTGTVMCQLLVHKEELCQAWMRLIISTQPLKTTIFWPFINVYFSFVHIGFEYFALPKNDIPTPALIWVAPKPITRHQKKARNAFYDDCGLPNQLDTYNHLLHNIDGRVILGKKHFDTLALNEDNAVINYEFSEAADGNWLKTKLDLSHLTPKSSSLWPSDVDVCLMIAVNLSWFVTSNASSTLEVQFRLLWRKNIIRLEPQEITIMRKSIAALERMGQIHQIHNGQWLDKDMLAPKPHQEVIQNIKDFFGDAA
jgi:hypothetical protein